MSYDEGYSNKRNKGKNKFKEKKKHPYKSGGKFRGTEVSVSSKGKENSSVKKKSRNK